MSSSLSIDQVEETQAKLQALLKETVSNTLLANRVPTAVAEKLAGQIANNIDMDYFYSIIAENIQDSQPPKQRILDRAIVRMFEVLYDTVYPPNGGKRSYKQDFFNMVPRGECLDLFLQLVKEYCMGDTEIEKHTKMIGPMIQQYHTGKGIDWDLVYENEQFKVYLDSLLQLILGRFHKDRKPIPALENKIPLKYQPSRMNFFLNQICLLHEKEKNNK